MPGSQRVTEGYGVLQPRISVGVVQRQPDACSAAVFSGHVGVDPYTTAVSDLYQDMFHEGSYVGKGIYDVDAFDAALAGRVPENTLLSHDLFEGFYARAGLVTDIDLVDDYPASYLAFSARQHRWVRGDWQIARWLWRKVPDASGRKAVNTLPVISRWKILTTCGGASFRPPSCCSLWQVGPSCPDRPPSGPRSGCWCSPSPPIFSWRDRSAATCRESPCGSTCVPNGTPSS